MEPGSSDAGQGEQSASDSVRLQIESKIFYIDYKNNARGSYLKLKEKAVNGVRSTIIVPEPAVSWFVKMLDYYMHAEGEPATRELEVMDKVFTFSVGDNNRGRFLRIVESGQGNAAGRSSIIIPCADNDGWELIRHGVMRICELDGTPGEALDDEPKRITVPLPPGTSAPLPRLATQPAAPHQQRARPQQWAQPPQRRVYELVYNTQQPSGQQQVQRRVYQPVYPQGQQGRLPAPHQQRGQQQNRVLVTGQDKQQVVYELVHAQTPHRGGPQAQLPRSSSPRPQPPQAQRQVVYELVHAPPKQSDAAVADVQEQQQAEVHMQHQEQQQPQQQLQASQLFIPEVAQQLLPPLDQQYLQQFPPLQQFFMQQQLPQHQLFMPQQFM